MVFLCWGGEAEIFYKTGEEGQGTERIIAAESRKGLGVKRGRLRGQVG